MELTNVCPTFHAIDTSVHHNSNPSISGGCGSGGCGGAEEQSFGGIQPRKGESRDNFFSQRCPLFRRLWKKEAQPVKDPWLKQPVLIQDLHIHI